MRDKSGGGILTEVTGFSTVRVPVMGAAMGADFPPLTPPLVDAAPVPPSKDSGGYKQFKS